MDGVKTAAVQVALFLDLELARCAAKVGLADEACRLLSPPRLCRLAGQDPRPSRPKKKFCPGHRRWPGQMAILAPDQAVTAAVVFFPRENRRSISTKNTGTKKIVSVVPMMVPNRVA